MQNTQTGMSGRPTGKTYLLSVIAGMLAELSAVLDELAAEKAKNAELIKNAALSEKSKRPPTRPKNRLSDTM